MWEPCLSGDWVQKKPLSCARHDLDLRETGQVFPGFLDHEKYARCPSHSSPNANCFNRNRQRRDRAGASVCKCKAVIRISSQIHGAPNHMNVCKKCYRCYTSSIRMLYGVYPKVAVFIGKMMMALNFFFGHPILIQNHMEMD